jgi:MFS family permease
MKNLSKRDYSILLGNAIDHFDTALYGFLAPLFAGNFFPSFDPIISLILAYSIFATTIITRPLGSYIFGMIAVSHGPAMSLSYSLIGVAISTLALGFLPTYEQIGAYAPALLILLRSLGGIFSSGEITIAKLYILAEKDEKNSNKSSYLYQTSSMVGIVLASFASTIVLASGNEHYWRICFVIGGITAFLGYFLRLYRTEKLSLNKQQLLKLYSFGAANILWKNKVLLLRIAIVSGFSYITYSIPFIVMNSLAPNFSKVTLENMMQASTVLLVIDMALLPIIGSCLKKISAKNTLLICAVLLFLTAFPMFYFATGASFAYIIFIKTWIIIIGVAFACKINLWSNNLIQEEGKYLIVGIGGSIGSATIGKMTPAICLSLYYYIGSPIIFAWFIALISIATAGAVIGTYRVSTNTPRISR